MKIRNIYLNKTDVTIIEDRNRKYIKTIEIGYKKNKQKRTVIMSEEDFVTMLEQFHLYYNIQVL